MLAELDAAGVPVSFMGAARFLWAAVRGRQPHRGMPARLKAVVARSDEVLDLPALRATLDDATRRGSRRDRRWADQPVMRFSGVKSAVLPSKSIGSPMSSKYFLARSYCMRVTVSPM